MFMIYFSHFSQHVTVAIEAIFRVNLLQEYESYLYNFKENYNNL
jgi:hypothetical protein